jgi:UDP-glucose:(heptosyl)LPS alpha-1,3-glucosyltransferase
MRIGIQIDRFDPARGGAEVYVHRAARRWIAAGHEVHVFTASAADPPAGCTVHAICPTGDPPAVRLPETGFDVLIGSGRCLGMNVLMPHSGTFPAACRQTLARLPTPAAAVQSLFFRRGRRFRAIETLERMQYAQANPAPAAVALSNMVASDMRRDYAAPPERIHVIHNGVDVEAFHPVTDPDHRRRVRRSWGVPAETPCFLFVGHDFARKGAWELLRAAAQLRRRTRRFRVVFVGAGNRAVWRAAAAAAGCGDAAVFAGPTADSKSAYAAADVFVLPTWYDPCSLSVLEAWACGLPAITTAFNGASELMTDGVEGARIAAPDRIDDLASAMERLLPPAARAAAGSAARALAERCTERRHLERLEELFRRVAGGMNR